ncbi:hypothetical protein [Tateyamaria sp. syn59]|uniref:hypothetical protein n=1 Tax=Tateyamaria sp. syn59 TaxID=2576942 RepID=UPI0011BE3351|nr:hypothetical protein [Tateyamaria sp. syn59]
MNIGFWKNLYYSLDEILYGYRERLLWAFSRATSKAPSKEERAERFNAWTSLRNDILLKSHTDLIDGSRPEATDMQRAFYRHLVAETKRLNIPDNPLTMHNSSAGLESHIAGWAAHFLPIDAFEDFYAETNFLHIMRAPDAMMHAWRAVEHDRTFPRLVAHQTKRLSEEYLGGIETGDIRETGLRHTRNIIQTNIKGDFEKGRAAFERFTSGEIREYEDLRHRKFFEFVQAETRASDDDIKDESTRLSYLDEIKIHGWATHFVSPKGALTYEDYEKFYARTIIAHRRHEVVAAYRALDAARGLPAFPPFQNTFKLFATPRHL